MRKNDLSIPYLGRLLPWFSVLVTCTSLWFISSDNGIALLVWELTAFLYILSVVTIAKWNSQHPELVDKRGHENARVWWLPLLTSLAGIYAAVVAMSANAQLKVFTGASVIAGLAALGVALSWFMLQIGFSNIYAHIAAKHGTEQLNFPETPSPTQIDYLYFALTVGATFATSDVTVMTSRMRGVVAFHSVSSFFYNALIVAVVFQVLQQLITTNL